MSRPSNGLKTPMKFFAKSEIATLALGAVVVAALAGAAWWALSGGTGASAQSNAPRERVVAVAVGKAVRKDVPYRVDAPGAVQPMVSVTVRARIDTQVERVAFQDGAAVKEGDVLFKLDARAIDAQIRQAEGQLARDQASLVKAKRDVERYVGLVGRGSISQVTLDDARTNSDVLEATVKQDEANLDNLRAQRTYYDVLAPATGRVGIPGVRAGAVVKSGDMLATVNQLSPIYIAFGVPERYIPDLRAASGNAKVDAALQNGVKASSWCARCSTTRTSGCGRARSRASGWRCASIRTWSPCRTKRCSAASAATSCSWWKTTWPACAR